MSTSALHFCGVTGTGLGSIGGGEQGSDDRGLDGPDFWLRGSRTHLRKVCSRAMSGRTVRRITDVLLGYVGSCIMYYTVLILSHLRLALYYVLYCIKIIRVLYLYYLFICIRVCFHRVPVLSYLTRVAKHARGMSVRDGCDRNSRNGRLRYCVHSKSNKLRKQKSNFEISFLDRILELGGDLGCFGHA